MTTIAPPRLTPAGSAAHRTRLRRRSETWSAGAIVVVWLTALFVLALWVDGGGIDAVLGGGASAVSALGRLSGLVASDLLLLQVLLMARVPLFERGFGRDGMVRMHRLVGFWSFSLMLVHIVLIVAGYAMAAGIDPISQLVQFVRDYPGVLLAAAGTVLVVLVALTSLRRARRRLRYESWHLLHLYGYLGAGLALPHQLWAGADFSASVGATWFWWTLWGLTAAAVIAYRIVLPLVRSARHRLRVVAVERDGDSGVAIRMRGEGLSALRVRPGQFFVWRFLDGPGWTRGHPFSLSAAPVGDELTVSARIVGDGTRRLAALRPGVRVLVEGPYGRMTGDERRASRLLLLGAGAGVAPLISLLEGEEYLPGEATIVTRDSARGSALRGQALRRLVDERGVRHVALDGPRARTGSLWLPGTHAAWSGADVIRFLAPEVEDHDVFICGPPDWMAAVVRDLRDAGVPGVRIHTESFSV